MRPTLLIDGNNLLVRAVEATRHNAMHGPDGTDTSALVVFIRTLARYIRDTQPYKAVVCWDAGYAALTALLPQYKANRSAHPDGYRRASRELATTFCTLARVPQARVDGYEADQLIASYWRTATTPVTILSSDKDMLQLVGATPTGHPCDQIRVSSAGTPTDRWGEEEVIAYYGCTPARLPDVLALAGDTADNIPGVPGIGPKFAVKHLEAAGWKLEDITHLRIREHLEQVAVYRQVVDLRGAPAVDLPSLGPFMPTAPGPDDAWARLHAFLTRLDLHDALRRLQTGNLW